MSIFAGTFIGQQKNKQRLRACFDAAYAECIGQKEVARKNSGKES
jgi:hypothetical protein